MTNSIIILTLALLSTPQPLQQSNRHISPIKPGRMSPTSRPVNPSQRPVRILAGKLNPNQRRKVVFVHVARRPAEFLENGEVFLVGDDGSGDGSVHFEPLGALAPLLGFDSGPHFWAVATAAHWAWEVVGFDESGGFGRD